MPNGDETRLPPNHSAQDPDRIEPAAVDAPAPGIQAITMYPGQVQTSLLPEDLRVPWDWRDILILVLLAVAGMVLVAIFLAKAFGLLGVTAGQLQKSQAVRGLFSITGQIVLDLGLLAYLAAQMRFRFGSPFWRTIGWRSLKVAGFSAGVLYAGLIAGGFVLAEIVSFAEPLFPPRHPLPLQHMLVDPRVAVLFAVMGVLLAPVVEETIFRGYLYPVVARSFGITAGIVITGILFGSLHAVQLWGGWWQIVLLVFVGIVLTSVRAATRTVSASYVVHMSYNAFSLIAPLILPHAR